MQLAYLDINCITEYPICLRPIQKDTQQYIELKLSILHKGLLNPITVNQVSETKFEVMDGLYRYEICKELEYKTIPAIVLPKMTEGQLLEYQLIKSVHTCVTTSLQYKQHMLRILSYYLDITIVELAAKINKILIGFIKLCSYFYYTTQSIQK